MMSKSLLRMRGLLKKELLQIRRDPSSIALALIMPLVLLFIFGYGISLDAENIPVALVMPQADPAARDLMARFAQSPYFEPAYTPAIQDAEQLLRDHAVECIVHLQDDFAARLSRGLAPAQIIVNGVDSNRANLILAYAGGVVQTWADVNAAHGGLPLPNGARVEPRIWFNDAMRSRNYLVPGLLTLVLTLIGVLLTSLVVAREWERGTMEAILATPLRPREFLLGKLLPYYLLGMGGFTLSVILSVTLFEVPLRGSIAALTLTGSLFMLASLGLGLFISAKVRIQFVAAQLGIVSGFLPALFLSGLLFDLGSAPKAIQTVSLLVPARYFVPISHTLFLAGDVWSMLLPHAAALAAMTILLLIATRRSIKPRLEN